MSEPGGDLLGDATEQDWTTLFAHARLSTYEPDEVVVDVGDADRRLFVVLQGSAEVLVPTRRTGRLRPVGHLDQGAVFGEVSFLDGLPRSARVRATTPLTVAGLDSESLDRLVRDYPSLAAALLLDLGRVLAGRLRAAEQRGT